MSRCVSSTKGDEGIVLVVDVVSLLLKWCRCGRRRGGPRRAR